MQWRTKTRRRRLRRSTRSRRGAAAAARLAAATSAAWSPCPRAVAQVRAMYAYKAKVSAFLLSRQPGKALMLEGLSSAIAGWTCRAEDVLLLLHGTTARCAWYLAFGRDTQ